MLFKKQKKIDSRVRFQNSRFKSRLQEARGYKRPKRPIPQTRASIFLAKIGLGSWLSKTLTVAAFFFLIYIVYIPNLFFIRHVVINGPNSADSSGALFTVNAFLDKNTPLPQKNLLLLSKGGLESYLLKNNQWVLKVNRISKKLPNTLILNITPRVDEFVLQTPLSNFSVSGDGLVTSQLNITASATLPQTLSLIKMDTNADLSLGQQALSAQDVNFINRLQSQLPDMAKSPLDYYEISDLQTQDLSVYLKSGVKFLFDLTSDPDETLKRLNFLLSQLTAAEIKNLSYVDMRFEDKGYICYKDTACVNDVNLPNSQATTTSDNLTTK